MSKPVKKLIKLIAPVIFWLGLWQLAAMLMDQELFVPYPATVFRKLAQLIVTARFWRQTAATLARVISGALLGVVTGAGLAGLTFLSPAADCLLSPAIRVVRATPVASFIILVLLWVGSTFVPVVISALMVMPVVWESASAGLRAPDPGLLEMARAYGMTGSRRLWYIYLPAAKPHLRSAVLSSIGLAWKSGVAAEVLSYPRQAIGTQIYYSKLYLEIPSLFAWTIVVVCLSMLIERLIRGALTGERGGGGQ